MYLWQIPLIALVSQALCQASDSLVKRYCAAYEEGCKDVDDLCYGKCTLQSGGNSMEPPPKVIFMYPSQSLNSTFNSTRLYIIKDFLYSFHKPSHVAPFFELLDEKYMEKQLMHKEIPINSASLRYTSGHVGYTEALKLQNEFLNSLPSIDSSQQPNSASVKISGTSSVRNRRSLKNPNKNLRPTKPAARIKGAWVEPLSFKGFSYDESCRPVCNERGLKLPDPLDRTKYWICLQGTPKQLHCSPDTSFDTNSGYCTMNAKNSFSSILNYCGQFEYL